MLVDAKSAKPFPPLAVRQVRRSKARLFSHTSEVGYTLLLSRLRLAALATQRATAAKDDDDDLSPAGTGEAAGPVAQRPPSQGVSSGVHFGAGHRSRWEGDSCR